MNESDAKAALKEMGVPSPSRQLVSDWLRMQQAEEWALELPDSAQEAPSEPSSRSEASHPSAVEHPSSKSNLAPLLRDRGELVRERGPRRAGRPPVQAAWFQAVAAAMADGTPLRQALGICGIYGLTPKQLRSLYRNRAFQALYKAARRKWLSEYGVKVRPRSKGLRQLLRSL